MLSLVLAGCGDDGGAGRLADAPPLSDAPVDAAPQPVTLTVTKNAAPVAGVHVYFLNPDSTVVATKDTDAAGTASALMPQGGSVTALDPFPPPVQQVPTAVAVVGDNDLRTFVGVKPGDHLVLTQTDDVLTDVTLLAANAPGAFNYEVRTSCGSGSISVGGGSGSGVPGGVVTLRNCHGTADILLIAQDAETSRPISYAYHPNADLSSGTVNLSDDAFQATTDLEFSYTNIPTGASSIDVLHSLVSPRAAIQQPFEAGTGLEGHSANLILTEPAITGMTGIVDTSVSLGGRHHVVDWGAVTATYALDMSAVLVPDLTDAPRFDPAAKAVVWTEGTSSVTPDLTATTFDVSRSDGLRHWRWTIAAPYTAGALALPTLPTDVADWTPVEADAVSVIALTNAKIPGGYDAARPHVLDLFLASSRFGAPGLDPRSLAGSAPGRAALVEMQLLGVRRARAR